MKLLLLCLAFGILPASCQQWVSSSGAPILLYAQFEAAPTPELLDVVHAELKTIMTPMGVEFAWRDLASASGNEVASELAVVHFRGRCDADDLEATRPQNAALGWTHVSDGVILPFSEVDCTRIRAFVQRSLLSLPENDREATLGRAIGRVLAHEMYHVFAKTARHGSCGVGKAAYSVEELLAPHFGFQEPESRAQHAKVTPRRNVGQSVSVAATR